ncbi:MAG: hypothetical protein JETCAE02_03020 [Anaerolineaceae bacterium]|nr:hypothetical protein [Anaerolineae bacterium]MBL1172921.1 hypothetical protein [Chloroflexota bacterium]WKZ55383.1 MAG: ABC transporter permease [Anaerolineales bacterium]GJQ37890.1 MAG: hypothetical protein JETCAE02_03020 [Anaerolineaceae bacterium]NOG76417.1 ABC transporter permease subunit [Chloroflexota bacterium]
MFFRLLSIEWTRLTRRTVLWLTLAASLYYVWAAVENYYRLTSVKLLDGTEKMPGLAFDLANGLDGLYPFLMPFVVIMAALVFGNDYSQRTNRHWLMHASRSNSLLTKFILLTGATALVQALAVVTAGITGWHYKTQVFHFALAEFLNVNWEATLAAVGYMTLVLTPYIALTALIAVLTRSAFASVVIGLGYTQFIEIVFTSIAYGENWTRWALRNLGFSATYLLNSIGNRVVEPPPHVFSPTSAFVVAGVYAAIFLSLAVWLYRRQDIGG